MKELERIIDDVSYGVRLRSRYQWYEGGEKSSKFFQANSHKQCLTKFENFPIPSSLYKTDALKIPHS